MARCSIARWCSSFPGPATATGEDLVELHCHGGRAVIEAVERRAGAIPGCRRAEPGEFTRRALTNGRIDLAEAQGLADLLAAETEASGIAAMRERGGAGERRGARLDGPTRDAAARVEAMLDFSDEDDVGGDNAAMRRRDRRGDGQPGRPRSTPCCARRRSSGCATAFGSCSRGRRTAASRP